MSKKKKVFSVKEMPQVMDMLSEAYSDDALFIVVAVADADPTGIMIGSTGNEQQTKSILRGASRLLTEGARVVNPPHPPQGSSKLH